MAFKRRTAGFNPTTYKGDMGAMIGGSNMSPNGMTDKSMEPGAALQPEMLPTMGGMPPMYHKKPSLPTHHPTILPKIPSIDKKTRYKPRG